MSEFDGFAGTGWGHAQHAIKFPPGGENTIDGLLLVRTQAQYARAGSREATQQS
jgi:hypothetical protein